jgi:hypothetical protein
VFAQRYRIFVAVVYKCLNFMGIGYWGSSLKCIVCPHVCWMCHVASQCLLYRLTAKLTYYTTTLHGRRCEMGNTHNMITSCNNRLLRLSLRMPSKRSW